MTTRAILALDIDGTITDEKHLVPKEVASYLKSLVEKDFKIMLITGRTFSFSQLSLENINFPYFLVLQNGADILKMPEKELISRNYLDRSVVLDLEQLYEHEKEDFLLYAGYERGDFCYYRPAHFSIDMLDYLETLKKLSTDHWQAVTTYSSIQQQDFPLIKCFGEKETLHTFEKKLKRSDLQMSTIRDPISGYLHVLLVTAKGASKGQALKRLKNLVYSGVPVIAAGDDMNDISMLKSADVKIVMQTAPHSMHDSADIIAPPSTECGIIPALEQAVKKWKI